MKIKFEWENIFDVGLVDGERTLVLRAKVYKGWLVKNIYYLRKSLRQESMVFIPDPNHDWEIE